MSKKYPFKTREDPPPPPQKQIPVLTHLCVCGWFAHQETGYTQYMKKSFIIIIHATWNA